jgi:hypothetical protein
MLRLVVLALVILIVWLLLVRAARRLRAAFGPPAAGARGRGDPAGAAGALDRLVPCAVCGVRFPARRALAAAGRPGEAYCSEACRRRVAAAAS